MTRWRLTRMKIGLTRDRFWRAFWLRQQRHLPPAAHVAITGCHLTIDKDATAPGISVEVGRTWKPAQRP